MRPGREWVRLQPLMHQHSLLILGTGVSPHFALQSLSRIAIAMHCIGSVLVGQVNKYKREETQFIPYCVSRTAVVLHL